MLKNHLFLEKLMQEKTMYISSFVNWEITMSTFVCYFEIFINGSVYYYLFMIHLFHFTIHIL